MVKNPKKWEQPGIVIEDDKNYTPVYTDSKIFNWSPGMK